MVSIQIARARPTRASSRLPSRSPAARSTGGMFGRERESSSPPPGAQPHVSAAEAGRGARGRADGHRSRHRDGRGARRRRRPAAASSICSPGAPKSYTVKRGDTLWDISSMFLRGSLALARGLVHQPAGRRTRTLSIRATCWPWPTAPTASPQIRLEQRRRRAPEPAPAQHAARRRDPDASVLRDRGLPGAADGADEGPDQEGARTCSRSARSTWSAAPATRSTCVTSTRPQNARFSVMHVGDPLRDPDDGDVARLPGHLHRHRVVTTPTSRRRPC